MPRYVILRHQTPPGYARPSHWDFLLESGTVLKCWALPEPPNPGPAQSAEQLPDHRLLYLDYEGPISGGRGDVRRWDAGTFQWLVDQPGNVTVLLDGKQLRGTVRLVRVDQLSERWELAYTAER
jgi:hypothetical protein